LCLGKSYGENAAVDLLHDKWADLMDQYLDSNYKKSSAFDQPDKDGSGTGKRSHVIKLYDPNATMSKRSRCQSPNDGSFSYLYSGRDDYQTASASSFRDLNRQTSPYQHLLLNQRGSPQTQSQRYPSPHQSVQSPTRSQQRNVRHSNVQEQVPSKLLLFIFLLDFDLTILIAQAVESPPKKSFFIFSF
jgi:hypothetical protein